MVTLILAGLSTVAAEPLALRTDHAPGASVVASQIDASAAWRGETWGAAVSWRPGASVGASAGRAWSLGGEPGRGWEAGVAAGVAVPLWSPALVLTATPYLHRVRDGERVSARGGLAVPSAVRLTGGAALRLPIQADAVLGVQVGPVRLGMVGGAGVVLSSGSPWALSGQVGLVATYAL